MSVAALVLVIHVALNITTASLRPKDIAPPDWQLSEVPIRLGAYRGVDRELDPRIFGALDADQVINREYRDDKAGKAITLHAAYFSKYDEAAYHNPGTCYRAAGWQLLKSEDLQLKLKDDTKDDPAPVRMDTWTKSGQTVLVVYWYQLGEHIVLDRWDMGWVRPKLASLDQWPVLVKVLLQIGVQNRNNRAADKLAIEAFAENAYRAINRLGEVAGLAELRQTLGGWHGKDQTSDSTVFRPLDAADALLREYKDADNRAATLFVANYDKYSRADIEAGGQHDPFAAYQAAGWNRVDGGDLVLEAEQRPVAFSVWENSDQRVMVIHWFRLGKRLVLNGDDLAAAQAALPAGGPKPPLVKVITQIVIEDPAQDKDRIQDFARRVFAAVDELGP